MKPRRGKLYAIIAVVAAIALGFGTFLGGWNGPGPLPRTIVVVVPQGATLASVARILERDDAIRSARGFMLRARLLGGPAHAIKAGEFRIPAHASAARILDILTGGRAVQRMVTIPEGMPAIEVQARLAAIPDLTGPSPLPPEGSVLPQTYSYEHGEPRAAVLARMQQAMTQTLDRLWADRAPDTMARTPQQALTLASIVEKETALPAERPIVAAVYSNRLRQGMMLQADPTIIYPITAGRPLGRRIRQSEIRAVNAYNTYAMVGLPKGPICNPGTGSIEAVLHPAQSAALYFVADGQGGHVFADTLAEQNRNVQRWYAIRRARGEM